MAEVFSMTHVLLCLEQLKVRDLRIAELEAEISEIRRNVSHLEQLSDERRKTIYELEAALTKYGRHLPSCPGGYSCNCKWSGRIEGDTYREALAQARREGIDMAINHLEKSDCPIPIDRLPPGQTKRQFSNTVIEFLILELHQMAREVKL